MRETLYCLLLMFYLSMFYPSMGEAFAYYWDNPRYFMESTQKAAVSDFTVVEHGGRYFLFFLTRGKVHSAIAVLVTGDFENYEGPFSVTGGIDITEDFYPQFDAISLDGVLYCVWSTIRGGAFFTKSGDGGKSWTREREVEKPGELSFQPLLFASGSTMILSFHTQSEGRRIDHFYMISEDRGETWDGPYVIARGLAGSFFPFFTVHRGSYFAAWQSRPLSEKAQPVFDIYLSKNMDVRSEWATPVNITGSALGEDVMPQLAVHEERLALLWESDRGGVWGIYYREYDLNGAPSSDAVRVNSAIFNAHHARALRIDGRLLIFYLEEREGRRRVGYAGKGDGGFEEFGPIPVIGTDVFNYMPVVRDGELHVLFHDRRGVAHIGPDRHVPAPRPLSLKERYIGLGGETVKWEQPADSSGLEGYCYVFGREETATPEIVNLPAGSMRLKLFAPEEGMYYLHLRAKDIAGNYSKMITIPFISDRTPPSQPRMILPPIDQEGYLEGNTPLFRWTDGGDDVAGYTYSLTREEAGELQRSILTSEPSVQYQDLEGGSWYFHVAAVDRAGNVGEPVRLAFSLRPPPPSEEVEEAVGPREGEAFEVPARPFRVFLARVYREQPLILIACFAVLGILFFSSFYITARVQRRRRAAGGGEPMEKAEEIAAPPGKGPGLRLKFSLMFGALVLIITLSISSVLSVVTIGHEKRALAEQMMDKAMLSLENMTGVAREGILNNDELLLLSVIAKMMENEDIEHAMILDTDGRVVAHSDIQERGKIQDDVFSIQAIQSERMLVSPEFSSDDLAASYDLSSPVTFAGRRIGTARLGYSTGSIFAAIKEARRSSILSTIVITLITIIAGIGSAVLMATITIKPIKVLARGANIIGGGNLEHRIQVKVRDEIGLLAGEFNRMTARLLVYQKEMEEKAKLEEQLDIARNIQQDLIPKSGVETSDLSIDGFYRAAARVGGDYYDFMEISDKTYGLIVSDVAGKGVPASLMMIMIRTLFKSFVCSGVNDPSRVVTLMNSTLAQDIADDRFATLLFGTFNPKKRIFRYANAGYGPILVYRAAKRSCSLISPREQSIPIGVMPDFMYQEEDPLRLKKGDILLLFTDGIHEARNREGQEYGMERLADVVGGIPERESGEIARMIMQNVLSFTGEAEQHDDMTLLVMKVH